MKEAILNIRKKLPSHVQLIAVSKTRTKEAIHEAITCGINDFGENRIQELLSKMAKDECIRWHMIGHLQRNKVKNAITSCVLIQSVDSLRLLDEINQQAALIKLRMPILLQVNIALEASKFGFLIEEIADVLQHTKSLSNVLLEGFMVIGPHTDDEQAIHQVFEKGHQLFLKYQQEYHLTTLSMGMSHDYHIALEHGTTMVRIGSEIFGPR